MRRAVQRERDHRNRSAREGESVQPRAAALVATDVLALQRGAGNQAVIRRLRGTQSLLQRKETGMRDAAPTSTFTKAAVDFWNDAANKSKLLEDFAAHLVQKANETLKALSVHEMLHAFDPKQTTPGNFDPVTWTMGLNTALFTQRTGVSKVSDLDVKEAATIAAMIYHEARHAEQHFRIARMVAGASKQTGADVVKEVMKVTQIPVNPATAAAGFPLAVTSANKQLLAEATDWEAVTSGRHGRYRNVVVPWELEVRSAKNVSFDPLRGVKARAWFRQFLAVWGGSARWKVVKDHIKTVKALKPKTSVDNVVLANLRAIDAQMTKVAAAWKDLDGDWDKLDPKELLERVQAFKKKPLNALIDALHNAYLAVPTEKDAWATGGAVEKQFLAATAPPKPKRAPRATAKP
jgi:hypothetical protein